MVQQKRELDYKEIMSLFKAVIWYGHLIIIISYGFICAKRKTEHGNRLFDLLVEGNKRWTRNAAVIVVAIARKNFESNEKFFLPH